MFIFLLTPSFKMFIFLLTPFNTSHCYYFGSNFSLVSLIKVLLTKKKHIKLIFKLTFRKKDKKGGMPIQRGRCLQKEGRFKPSAHYVISSRNFKIDITKVIRYWWQGTVSYSVNARLHIMKLRNFIPNYVFIIFYIFDKFLIHKWHWSKGHQSCSTQLVNALLISN